MKLISKAYLKLTGWKVKSNPPKEVHEKCVMICAPHTSNWDFPITLAIMNLLNVKARYAMKKELMGFPFGGLLRGVGAIAIDRKAKQNGEKKQSTVQAIAELFNKEDNLCLMIAAEGTRSLQKEWKTGFYYIALQAKVPICLAYLDYKTKIGGFGKAIYPTGDIHADMAEIMDFFKDKTGKKPANFSLDHRFVSKDMVPKTSSNHNKEPK